MILRAVEFMLKAHAGQFDKGGLPYYHHPLRIAQQLQDENEIMVALLHDVVEDSRIPLETIQQLFGPRVADLVDYLSRREGEVYHEYIARVKKDPVAMKIKLLDLRDNLLEWRVENLTASQVERYHATIKHLEMG